MFTVCSGIVRGCSNGCHVTLRKVSYIVGISDPPNRHPKRPNGLPFRFLLTQIMWGGKWEGINLKKLILSVCESNAIVKGKWLFYIQVIGETLRTKTITRYWPIDLIANQTRVSLVTVTLETGIMWQNRETFILLSTQSYFWSPCN